MSKISGMGHYYHVALISCVRLFMILSVGHGCGSRGSPFHDCPVPTSPPDSAVQNNLLSLFSILQERASTSTSLFHNTSTGRGRDQVYGRAVCKSNVAAATCAACLRDLSYSALQLCHGGSDDFLWCPLCSIRYGNWSFFGTLDSQSPFGGVPSEEFDVKPSMEQFALVSDLVEKTPIEKSLFWEQELGDGARPSKLGVGQCTPDLSVGDCLKCLKQLKNTYNRCCQGKGDWYVVKRSCYIVYGDKSTIDSYTGMSGVANGSAPKRHGNKNASSTPPEGSVGNANGGWSPLPQPGAEKKVNSGRARNLLSAFLGGSSVLLVIIIGCFLYCFLERKKEAKGTERKDEEALLKKLRPISYPNDTSEVNIEEDFSSTRLPMIDLATLMHATNNFSNENKLGEGGFGPVYKGVMRDGREIAIKRLSKSSGQGLREFKNEIILIAKLQHKNLVRLLNCCVEGGELLLVYEFLANKSLDIFLFDSTKRVELDFQRRLDIILGIARGVQYLHEDSRLKIIHRDLKASNILLDHEMNPKISDFGMARIFESKQNHLNTCRVVGTYGYMAPEYAMEGIFSVKTDVYSFGVLLLEIVSGKRNSGFYLTKNARSLLEHAWQLWCEGNPLDLIDPFVIRSYSANEALRCIHIGFLCVQQDAADRPTMSVVVLMLASASVDLPRPTQPAVFVSRESMGHQSQPSTSRKTCSINEITVTYVEPR